MAFKIKWTKRAEKGFEEKFGYIVSQFGNQSANNYINKIDRFLNILTNYPDLGHIVHELKEIRCFNVTRFTSIYYRVKDHKIILLRLIDTRKRTHRRN